MFPRKRELLYHKNVDNDVYASNGHKYNKIAKVEYLINHFLDTIKAVGEVYYLSYPQCQISSNSDGDVCKILVN